MEPHFHKEVFICSLFKLIAMKEKQMRCGSLCMSYIEALCLCVHSMLALRVQSVSHNVMHLTFTSISSGINEQGNNSCNLSFDLDF